MPVVCEACGRLWFASNIFGGSAIITLKDVGVGGCPDCGGMGRIPDGVYHLAEDSVRVLSGLPAHVVRQIADAARAARRTEATADDFANELSRIGAEAGIADQLHVLTEEVRRLGRPGWQYWLMLLATLLPLILARCPADSRDSGDPLRGDQVTLLIQEAFADAETAVLRPVPTKNPGRNEQCWCGTGRKFKHCHGAVDRR